MAYPKRIPRFLVRQPFSRALKCQAQPLITQDRAGEKAVGLLLQRVQLFVAGGIVADHQPLHLRLLGDLGGLSGGAVKRLFGAGGIAFRECGLVIEQIYPLDVGDQRGLESGVRTVGIALGRRGRTGQSAVGNHLAFRCHEVGSLLDPWHHGDRHLIEIGHLPQDVGRLWLLGEKVATAGNAMLQRQGLDLQRAILHNQLMLSGVNRVETHLKRQTLTEEVEQGPHEIFHGSRPMNHQFAQPSQHAQRGDQARKPEAMIAV